MKVKKSFWERHLAKIIGSVLAIALFGTLGLLRNQQIQQYDQKFYDKLTMFKKPPPDAVKGGHWHSDGTWHNKPHTEKPKQIPNHSPKTTEKPTKPHPHDLLTDEEHAEVHKKQEESEKKSLKLLAESERELADSIAQLSEAQQAYMERAEFEQLIPNFQKQILEYEDYDFILTYPTPVEMIEKFSNPRIP